MSDLFDKVVKIDSARQSSETISQKALERHVWDAQEILRGNVDASEFKDYIFGMFFLKAVVDNSNLQNFNERWQALCSLETNIGDAVNALMASVEDNTPDLRDTLTNFDYRNKRLDDDIIGKLVRHYDKVSLHLDNLETPDALGHAYEYLLGKFADSSGSKGGEFYTPPSVTELVARIINPNPDETIYDPTCGTGGLLLKCAINNNEIFGQELNASTAVIARINLYLHNLKGTVRQGNTLTDPKHLTDDNSDIRRFDCVVANPPFSVKKWGSETPDKFNRYSKYGKVPQGQADYAFIIHCLESIAEGGRGAVIMPPGTLFRSGAEGKMRKAILQSGYVYGIINLPGNLFYNTSVNTCIWLFDKSRNPDEQSGMVIVNASRLYRKENKQHIITEDHANQILKALNPNTESIPRLSQWISLKDVEDNDWNLNVARFVDDSFPILHIPGKSINYGGIPASLINDPFVIETLTEKNINKLFVPHPTNEDHYWFNTDNSLKDKHSIRAYIFNTLKGFEITDEVGHIIDVLCETSKEGLFAFNKQTQEHMDDWERMIKALDAEEDTSIHMNHPDSDVPLAEWPERSLKYRIDTITENISNLQARLNEITNELNKRTAAGSS